MKKEEILDKAKEIINGPRKTEYGDPNNNFDRIAKMWSVILNKNISASQVAQCMIALKLTRLIQNEDSPDSYLDIVGYAAIGGEVSQKLKGPYNNYNIDIKEGVKSISHWGIK